MGPIPSAALYHFIEVAGGMSVATALIIDDSVIARMYLRSILERVGLDDIVEAEDGNEGIAVFKTSLPDLVLLDIEMPGMDGLGALKVLAPIKGKSRIVMATAVENSEVIEDCLLAGADDYIRKDLSEDVIEQRLREIIPSAILNSR